MKIVIEVEDLSKIGYTHEVRMPSPDIHHVCLAGELAVNAVGTIKAIETKVGNGSKARPNADAVQVTGLKSIEVGENGEITIEGNHTVVIKQKGLAKSVKIADVKATTSKQCDCLQS